MYPLINEVTSRLCLRYDYWLRKNNQACDGSCSLRVEAKASSLRRPWLAACGGYGWLPAEAMVGCQRMSWLAACGGHGWLPAEALAGCLRRPWLAACGGAGWQRPAEALADSLRRPWLAACEGPGWQRPAEALAGGLRRPWLANMRRTWLAACAGPGWQHAEKPGHRSLRRTGLAARCGGPGWQRHAAGEASSSDGPGPSTLERGAGEGESPVRPEPCRNTRRCRESGERPIANKYRTRKDEKDFEKRVKECLKLSGGKRMGAGGASRPEAEWLWLVRCSARGADRCRPSRRQEPGRSTLEEAPSGRSANTARANKASFVALACPWQRPVGWLGCFDEPCHGIEGSKWAIFGKQNWRCGMNRKPGYGAQLRANPEPTKGVGRLRQQDGGHGSRNPLRSV
ncbi:hypothetical protein KFK09_029384 [Dendrobium nobile]|uniref:Uncharacterized protein n=1 Tax=Dendrobium nobile TaxID=94219 RepID=A0A8T3A123_DENNO|nr:hypothetical protein KFK09_029384 [Dendrobium nobile]